MKQLYASVAIFYFTLIGAIIYGWVVNLIAVIHLTSDVPLPLAIARCLGLVFVPLGAILGIFA